MGSSPTKPSCFLSLRASRAQLSPPTRISPSCGCAPRLSRRTRSESTVLFMSSSTTHSPLPAVKLMPRIWSVTTPERESAPSRGASP